MPVCGFAGQLPILGRSAETADFQILTSQGDFLCYRGENSGSGYDAGRAQLRQESLVTSHQGPGPAAMSASGFVACATPSP